MNNPPAFPGPTIKNDIGPNISQRGMTLRDYFAAAALQGLIASDDEGAGDRIDEIPTYAYHIADAMLKAREE